MRKLLVSLMLLEGLALASPSAWAKQGQDFSKVEIKATKVSGNIYMLEGAGGNIAASIGEDDRDCGRSVCAAGGQDSGVA